MTTPNQSAPEQLKDLGEEEIVRRLITGLPQGSLVLIGPGDDCAVSDASGEELLLHKTDAIVEGVHYLADTNAERVGWKAAARVVSDFGAMGGRPSELLVTVALPSDCSMSWLEGLYRGLSRCAKVFQFSIVGGETVGLPEKSLAMISIAGTGRVARDGFVTRSGGNEGDGIWVTGMLGGSFASGHHLDFRPRVEEGQWLAAHARPTAMMDLSDGLRRDLPRLATASQCGFELWQERLPCNEGCSIEQALGDGEDMELLFSADAGDWEQEFREQFPTIPLTRIGTLTQLGEGGANELGEGGWQHFQER